MEVLGEKEINVYFLQPLALSGLFHPA